MSDKMRKALEWLAGEMRDELTDDGASLPQWLVKSWLKRCDEALAEQPARGNAVAWWTDHPTVCGSGITTDHAIADAWRNAKYNVRPLYTAPPAPAVPDNVAKDAARWRFCESHPGWLRQVRKGKAMWFAFASPTTNYEYDIYPTARKAIDAAMLAAAPARKS